MMTTATDLDDLLDSEPAFRSGEVALWMAVTINAFFTLRDGGGYQNMARGWIEDPDNGFFEAICDEIGYSAEGLRQRIREALERTHEDHAGRLALYRAHAVISPQDEALPVRTVGSDLGESERPDGYSD
jgi:hypothetical protein